MHHLIPDWVLLDSGFVSGKRISIERGAIVAIEDCQTGEGGERVPGALLPGMTDLHSHAFQRSMAGLAEHARGPDDFWSWRDAMYAQAERINPDGMRALAAYVAMGLLEGGYTALVEFHYLFHDRNGKPYADRSEMARAVAAGASEAGMPLTLLFSVYETDGFGASSLADAKRRFANPAEEALEMLSAARDGATTALRFGVAPHSLRAVPPASLAHLLEGLAAIDPDAPIHIHVAEQSAEVRACIEDRGLPPVAWLLDHAPVGPTWCLIHATHTSAAEKQRVAATGAVTGLCPTTEANLGDGIFDLPALLAAGGRFGIGSDSNVCLDAFAELCCLEYSQRLACQRRNLAAGAAGHSGPALWRAASAGGAQAAGRPAGAIAVGMRADLVAIGPSLETGAFAGSEAPAFWLDAAIFAARARPARDVMVSGEWRVRDGVHVAREPITRRYRDALAGMA